MLRPEQGVTLGQLLAASELRLRQVAGPQDPARVLRWAHSTELLAPGRHLRGRELLLTVGSGLTSAERCEDYVRELLAAGASAVGLGVGDVHDAVPPALGAACDRQGLPLLRIPYDVPFQLLTELLAEHRVAERLAGHVREGVGRLLRLVVDGLVDPGAVADELGVPAGGMLAAVAWPAEATTTVRAMVPDVSLGAVGPAVVGLVASAAEAAALAARHGLPCGTGAQVRVGDLARSVRGALAALEVSLVRGRPVASAQLATLEALLDRLPETALRPFLEQLLTPLVEHDARTGSQLLTSLQALTDGGGAVVPTARALFVHPNTLRHRMARVAELTGRDPLEENDRLCFTVAFAARRRRGPRPTG